MIIINKKLFLIVIFFVFSINVYSQKALTKNEMIQLKNINKKEFLDYLTTIRYSKNYFHTIWRPFDSKNNIKIYNTYFDDYSVNSLIDTKILKRIIQLLKNEYDKNEYDKVIDYCVKNESLNYIGYNIRHLKDKKRQILLLDTTTIEYKNFRDSCILERYNNLYKIKYNEFNYNLSSLLELCQYIHNNKITKQLISMYNDSLYKNYIKTIENTLIFQKVEPFYSNFISKNKYEENIKPFQMVNNIEKLFSICYHEQGIYEISKYLQTDKIDVIDNSIYYDTKDTIDLNNILSLEDNDDLSYIPISYYVYDCLCNSITNQSFWNLINLENPFNNEKIIVYYYDDFKKIDKKKKEIYLWLMNNYGNYKLWRLY